MTTKGKLVVVGVLVVVLGVVLMRKGNVGDNLLSSVLLSATTSETSNSSGDATTIPLSSFDNPTTSSPQKTTCTQEEVDRVTREVNSLSGSGYLVAVNQEIVARDPALQKLGTAALRDYVMKNVKYFKARLIQIRLAKMCTQ